MNYNDFQTVQMQARTLIEKLGEKYYSCDDLERDEEWGKKYESYGFLIKAKYDSFNQMSIEFRNKTVFSTNGNYFVPGDWQLLLQELYNKIPNILKKQEDHEKFMKKAAILYSHIQDSNFVIEKDSIIVKSYKSEYQSFQDDIYSDTTYTTQVIKNDKVVFKYQRTYNCVYECTCPIYIPGEWENELDNYLEQCRLDNLKRLQREKEAEKQAIQDTLQRIRNI